MHGLKKWCALTAEGKWLKILHSSNFWATNYNLKVFYLLEQWIFKSAIFWLLPKHFNNSNFHWPNVLSQPIRNQLSYHHGLSNFGVRTSETIYFFFKHCVFFFFTDFYVVFNITTLNFFSKNLHVLQNPLDRAILYY